LFTKKFSIAKYRVGGAPNGYIVKILYEALKTALTCGCCHDKPGTTLLTSEEEIQREEAHELALQEQSFKTYRNGIASSIIDNEDYGAYRNLLRIKEYPQLILELYLLGAFRAGRATPMITYEELGGVFQHIVAVDIRDICKYRSDEEWRAAPRTSRVRSVTRAVLCVGKKWAGKCHLCRKCIANLSWKSYSGVEVNHRLHKRKTLDISEATNIMLLVNELIDKDCEVLCRACHEYITLYQKGLVDRPRNYPFNRNGRRRSV
jgi:hypothetical protein